MVLVVAIFLLTLVGLTLYLYVADAFHSISLRPTCPVCCLYSIALVCDDPRDRADSAFLRWLLSFASGKMIDIAVTPALHHLLTASNLYTSRSGNARQAQKIIP